MSKNKKIILIPFVIFIVLYTLGTSFFEMYNLYDIGNDSSREMYADASTEQGSAVKTGSSSLTSSSSSSSSSDNNPRNDIFGIKKIYPTKNGGREWFMNMDDPRADGTFFITSDQNITKQADGSWHIKNPSVRLNVDTPPNAEPWKNVEITGYLKMKGTISSPKNNNTAPSGEGGGDVYGVAWRARSGEHYSSEPCEGTAYISILDINGTMEWKKKIWHTGGYTNGTAKEKVVPDGILNKWIGFKIVVYNINNDSAVKMESYIDNKNTNYWVKVPTDVVDDGNWYSKSSDKEFYSANCGKPKNYIITNGRPLVQFRSDNILWDFKNLSVREIQPP